MQKTTKTLNGSLNKRIVLPKIDWEDYVAFLFGLPLYLIKYPAIFPIGFYALLLPFDGLLRLGEVGTVTKYLGIITIIVLWTNKLILAEERKFRLPPVTWSWALFMVLAGLSGLWALSPIDTFSSLYTTAGLFLIYVSIGMYPFKKRDYSLLIKFVIIGGTAAAIYSLWLYMQGITLPYSIRTSLMIGDERRVDPNHFAVGLILSLMFSFDWLVRSRGINRIWATACASVIGLAIFLSGSRGGMLGAIVASMLFFWRIKPRINLRHILVSSIILIIVGIFVLNIMDVPDQILERFQINTIIESRGSGRFYIWSIGCEAFFHKPMIGYGYENFSYAYDLFYDGQYYPHMDAHNLYLQIFVELGLIGGLLLLLIVWRHWREIHIIGYSSISGIALEAAFIGVIISSASLGTLRYKYFWFIFSLIIMYLNAHRKSEFIKSKLTIRGSRYVIPND